MASERSERLEIGGSAFEIVEFTLDRRLANGQVRKGVYGVNVEKVREVVRMPQINPLASSHPVIAGIFELRGVPIPAVNLCRVLGDRHVEPLPDQQIIVTEFSHKRAGFVVSCTNRIRRIAWEKVLPPASDIGACINGMTLIEGNEFLFILDLERILIDIEGVRLEDESESISSRSLSPSQAKGDDSSSASNGFSILLVDDSRLILNNARSILEREGYRVRTAANGVEAQGVLRSADQGTFHLVVTDVEMPQLDGISLTKWIRSQSHLEDLPVVLHTSLSGRNAQEAGLLVGANGYVIKNNAMQLLELVGEILGVNRSQARFGS